MPPVLTVGRFDGDCAGQIPAQHLEQLKFPFSVHACLFRKVLPKVPLRQQIGKEGHQPHPVWAKVGAQFTELILEVQSERWVIRIVSIR